MMVSVLETEQVTLMNILKQSSKSVEFLWKDLESRTVLYYYRIQIPVVQTDDSGKDWYL